MWRKVHLYRRDLESHELVGFLMDYVSSNAILKIGGLGDKTFKIDDREVSPGERYAWNVFYYVLQILEAVELLDFTAVFSAVFPRYRSFERAGLTRSRYLYYHFHTLIETVFLFRERCFRLINMALLIGIDQTDTRLMSKVESDERFRRLGLSKITDRLKSRDHTIGQFLQEVRHSSYSCAHLFGRRLSHGEWS